MCKVCKLGLSDLVDHLLSKGWSYRKIADHLISEYRIPISRMSIKRHADHRKAEFNDEHKEFKVKEKTSFLGLSAKPIVRSYC